MGHCLLFLSKTPQYTKYFNFRLQKTPYLRHQSQTSSEHRSDLLSGSYQCECTIPCTGSSFSILWQWYQDSFGFKSTSFEGALRQVLNMQPRQARKLQSASLVLVKSVYHHTWLQVKLLSESVYFLLLCFSFLFFSFSFFVFSRQGFSVQPWLFWNSICRPGWPRTQKSTCLCLPSAGIKGVHHHHPATYSFYNFSCTYTHITNTKNWTAETLPRHLPARIQ